VAFCKSCGGRFDWYKTDAGKFMPVEPDPAPDGTVAIDVVSNIATVVPAGSKTQLYRSHWATCTGASKHRKGRP